MTGPLLRLSVSGDRIVDSQGYPVSLRGVNHGGWMNLENFIYGYPGSEHGLRQDLVGVIQRHLTSTVAQK